MCSVLFLLKEFVSRSCHLPYLRALGRRVGALCVGVIAKITVVVMGNIIHWVAKLEG